MPDLSETARLVLTSAADLAGYTQHHFFAGIGLWSYALRRAGWDDSRPCWTGSAPCQPFSVAGKRLGEHDERHLWPAFHKLIRACRPPVIFGEQVSAGPAMGKRPTSEMLALWSKQEYLGLLQDRIERQLSLGLQGMPEHDGPRMARGASAFDVDSGEFSGSRSEGEGRSERNSLRSDSIVDTEPTRRRDLRSDGYELRYGSGTRMEHPIAGSHQAGGRLHTGQHEGGVVRIEHGMWGLGRRQNSSDCLRHLEEAARGIACAIDATRREIETASGESWVNLVQTDLENSDYTFGATVLCSAGVGAPNIRHRLYWVADAARGRSPAGAREPGRGYGTRQPDGPGDAGRLADIEGRGWGEHRLLGEAAGGGQDTGQPALGDEAAGSRMEHPEPPDAAGAWPGSEGRAATEPGRPHDPWGSLEWISCTDGKYRPTQSGIQRVADGNSSGLEFLLSSPETAEVWPLAIRQKGDVQKLRGYGNAINPVVATEVIRAYMELDR